MKKIIFVLMIAMVAMTGWAMADDEKRAADGNKIYSEAPQDRLNGPVTNAYWACGRGIRFLHGTNKYNSAAQTTIGWFTAGEDRTEDILMNGVVNNRILCFYISGEYYYAIQVYNR